MGLNLEILEQKIGRVAVVGIDAAYLRCGQHHHRGFVFTEPLLHCQWIEQVISATGVDLLVVTGALKERLMALPAIPGLELQTDHWE